MEQAIIEKINDQVFKQFPYLEKKPPTIKQNPDGTLSLKYMGESKTANGITIPLSVKIKTSQDGNIIQITSSR